MGLTILVVDDEKSLLDLIDKFLKAQGHSVETASNLKTAKVLVEINCYDILLVDKNMPSDNDLCEGGMDFLRFVKSNKFPSQVVMMTGYPTLETVVEAMKLGAFDYLEKPFSLAKLGEIIKRLEGYRHFINPDYTLNVYRHVRSEILKLFEDRNEIHGKALDAIFLQLNSAIDHVFALLKENKRYILMQRESLSRIANIAEQIKSDIREADCSNSIDEISRLSRMNL